MPINQKELWQNLPSRPGVYLFKNKEGTIFYVGKAINLKKRVSSYFARDQKDRPWIAVMMGFVADVETIVVTNEIEALMLEATLIKQHMPRFNIKLTDDKAYPYIRLSKNEPIARFSIARKREGNKATYFGPFLSGRAALHTLEFLRKLYGIHISPKLLRGNRDRACLNCQLGGFTCPLNGEVDEQTYNNRIKQAVDFLQGKRNSLVDDLEEKMIEASNHEQFELAAKFRDRLKSVMQVLNRQQVITNSDEDYDVIGTSIASTTACVAVLRIQGGRVVGSRTFFFHIVGDEKTVDVIRNFLISIYYNFSNIPKLVVLPEQISDEQTISDFLTNLAGRKVEMRVAERGDKYQLVNLAERNAQSKLETRLMKSDHAFTGVIALQELLKLPELPCRIEAVDISNLGTSEPVGATVCFINGQPDKKEYRRYKIKTVEGQNDFAMIREVVERRFGDTSRPIPDLFMVDGGPEQLKFALAGLKNSPMQPKAIIALAKKPDRIFLPERKSPLPVSRGNKGLLLLSRARDEVHRFVIGFQRKRQAKKSLHSEIN